MSVRLCFGGLAFKYSRYSKTSSCEAIHPPDACPQMELSPYVNKAFQKLPYSDIQFGKWTGGPVMCDFSLLSIIPLRNPPEPPPLATYEAQLLTFPPPFITSMMPPSSHQFERGEGYFALRNVKDTSGITVISHPKANTPSAVCVVMPLLCRH